MSSPGDPNLIADEARALRPRPTREPSSRKKACEQCSVAKVRCDHKKPQCSRCESRKTNCNYASLQRPTAASPQSGGQGEVDVSRSYGASGNEAGRILRGVSSQKTPTGNDPGFAISASTIPNGAETIRQIQTQDALPNPYWPGEVLSFANIDLICTVDSSRIGNRWLGDFIPAFHQRVKNYQPSTIHFISRVLKTYPSILLKEGQLPPFIHASQLSGSKVPTPLANCLSLVRMWGAQVRGSESMVREIIRNEMNRLFEERQLETLIDQLAAFQAYLIYGMMLFFADDQPGKLIDRQVMINLQDFACDIACSGLVCVAELSGQRPEWESWIVASTKQRSLYTTYLFDNLFCSLSGLPTFLGEELESLPAPASKTLWEATDRSFWTNEYNKHLGEWPGGALRIDELWPAPETGIEERRKRVDKWLGSVDEFGMMLFAITLATHGG